MKFITFVNLAYTDMCYNLYKQLSVFDRHEDLTVVCTDINTFNKLAQYKMDCQIEIYKPFAITDHINLINNVGVKYTPEQVLKLKPMTFHPTFEADKIQFIKDCNQWFVE